MIFYRTFLLFGRKRRALYGGPISAYFIYDIFWNIYYKITPLNVFLQFFGG